MWKAKVKKRTKAKPLVFKTERKFGYNPTGCDTEEEPTFEDWKKGYKWELIDKVPGDPGKQQIVFRGYNYSDPMNWIDSAVLPEGTVLDNNKTAIRFTGENSVWDEATGLECRTFLHLMRNQMNEKLPWGYRDKHPRESDWEFHSSKKINGDVHSIYVSKCMEANFMLYKIRNALSSNSCENCAATLDTCKAMDLFGMHPFVYVNEQKMVRTILELKEEKDTSREVKKRLYEGDKFFDMKGSLKALYEILEDIATNKDNCGEHKDDGAVYTMSGMRIMPEVDKILPKLPMGSIIFHDSI